MPYQIQVGSQVVEFPDSVGQDEAQRVLAEQFPATGEDISLALQDPTFKPSAADYAKYEEYAKTRQTDWLNTIAQSVDVAAGMIGGAISQGVQGAAANPLNYIEGAAQGTRQLYGLVAQSQDPASPLFKFKDLVAGTGTPESRYQQFLEARDFANTTARLERGEEGLFVPPELTNPEFVQGVSMILDPTLVLPGIGEALGAGKLATKAVGRGAQLAGRAVTGVAAPVERLVTGAERIAGEALSVSPEALRTTAATTGIAGALGIAPEAAALAAVPAAVRTTREVGEAITRAGENLLTQPSRIGPLEAIGAAPGANMRQRMLGVIGQYGGDAALDAALRSTAGAIEGATIGTGLGYLSGGEEGAAAGLGTGMVQGAAGVLAARGIERLTGKAAREARAGDLGRFIDSQQDPTTKALFERVRDTHGVDAASALMDVEALTKGRFGDIDVLYRSNKDFSDQFGGSARGVQVVQAERPTIVINADIIGRGQGDTPLYTLGHELFHALEKSEQLSAGATEIKDALVGRWIQEGDVTRKLAEGALTDADIEARFNQYRDKLAAGNAEAAAELARYDTINKKADYIASEIAAEHFARLIAGQQPDAMLKGFSGLTRQLMDAALTQNVSKAIANAAASIERTFGVKPTDSVLFPDLKQASPQLNAMLRDLVRARRKLDERILAEDAGPARTLKPQDVANPVAATQLVELGLAERMPDGSVRSLSDEEIRVREEKDTTTLKTILESLPGARVVDGEIQGRFSPQQLSAIEQSQAVSSRMKDKIRAVASAMDNGNSIFVNYGAATRRVKNRLTGKFSSKYSSGIRLSQREVLPYSFYLSKADNPVVKVIDLTKIRSGLERLTAPDGSIAGGLWDNVDGFMGDLAKYFTNLDAKENARRSSELFGADKARFLGDFVNEQEKGGRKFVRDLRLDRIGSTASMPFRARISEDAIQLSKLRWMPAETVGDKSVINSDEGYRIISGAKHKLYGPDGKLLGIFDTQTQAERKADATQARLQPEVDQQQRPARDEGRQAAEAGRGDRALGRPQGREEGRQELGPVRQAGDVRFMPEGEVATEKQVAEGLPRRASFEAQGVTRDENGNIFFKGKEPKDWSPKDFEDYGKAFGVQNLGPLSPIVEVPSDVAGTVARIPGGLDGKFTYYDLLWLKANPVDVAKLPETTHAKLTAKLASTMAPTPGDKVASFNSIVFGMLSPNAPLLPNEMGQARLRFGSMDEIRKFSELYPSNPTPENLKALNERFKRQLGFIAAGKGGLGIPITADITNIANAARLFVKNPDFFVKRPNESWANFVDKLTTQVKGFGTKTGSFGSVWQDPFNASISAMDRHMARIFGQELLGNPELRKRFDGIVVDRFNSLLTKAKDVSSRFNRKLKTAEAAQARIEEKNKGNDELIKQLKAASQKKIAKIKADMASELDALPDPSATKANTIDDVLGQAEIYGVDRVQKFVNEAVFAAMGSRKATLLAKKGGINPNAPEHIKGIDWIETPADFQVMSDAYRSALEINERRAGELGIAVFPAQWTLWDRIRQRVEPHEVMFPGLEKLPALNDRQLADAYNANKVAGYMSTPEAGRKWKRSQIDSPSRLAYFMPSDTDYLSAVQKGDTQAAQRMVDEAAKAAGINRKADPETVRTFWRVGKPPKGGRSYNTKDNFFEKGVSTYFYPEATSFAGAGRSDWYKVQGTFVGYGSDGEPLVKVDSFKKGAPKEIEDALKNKPKLQLFPGDSFRFPKYEDYASEFTVRSQLRRADGSLYGYEIAPKSISKDYPIGSQIPYYRKLGPEFLANDEIGVTDITYAPITRDDAGNVIPLSKRFQASSEDIRFMPDYSGEHRAPRRDSGAPLDNLKGVYPDDVYGPNAARYYGHESGSQTDKAAVRIIQATKGKPDAPVKVFRAIPKSIESNEINPGDWITTIKSYAVQHGEGPLGGDYKILEKTVPAGDLYTDGNSIFEFGYDPKFMPQPDSSMPGAYSFPGGYRALPGKANGSLRLYGPAGSLIGIAASLDEAQRIIRRKTRQ